MDQNPVSDNTATTPPAGQIVDASTISAEAPAETGATEAAATDSGPATPTTELINAMDDTLAPLPDVALEIAEKIAEAQNVLVALSSDPSVDEMAAAIGLSLFLDKLGKRATAIYSGTTPNALQFLKPEETFEASADTLQDFVIALNKEKADHLRYKLDGDFVKIFITPYKTRVSQDDLSFSYGDYNVDLVLALDVANGVDLDSALREHGRIMHDAVIVDITTGNPGKLGEIEWSDKKASSVSEMVAKLLYGVGKDRVEKDEATAFLTGIVATTNRFSNAKTTPETMQIASRLMRSGANQQLVSKNITPDIDNELLVALKENAPAKQEVATEAQTEEAPTTEAAGEDPTELTVAHDAEPEGAKEENAATAETAQTASGEINAAGALVNEEPVATAPVKVEEPAAAEPAPEIKAEPETVGAPEPTTDDAVSLLEDLKKAEASLAQAGNEVVTESAEKSSGILISDEDKSNEAQNGEGETIGEAPKSEEEGFLKTGPEKVLQPISDDLSTDTVKVESEKYGEMLEEALSDSGAAATPAGNETAPIQTQPQSQLQTQTQPQSQGASNLPPVVNVPTPGMGENPAVAMAPQVATKPEINGVPEINFTPAADAEILPPPPVPPVDMSAPPLSPPTQMTVPPVPTSAAEPAPATTSGAADVAGTPVANPGAQSADPAAFKIPGM